MKEQFVDLIVGRLSSQVEELRDYFQKSCTDNIRTRHVVIDNLLPAEVATMISSKFPGSEEMRLMDSFRERKRTSKNFNAFDPILKAISDSFQDPKVIAMVEQMTGIEEQQADPTFYAGGLSTMREGDFLNPHIDNSHDAGRKLYRTLNLLYYVTPGWTEQDGGSLELWDEKVKTAITIPALFNRLVLMETNKTTWHSVNAIKGAKERQCVSNYYFSPKNPNDEPETFHITFFHGRPDEPWKRLLSVVDGTLRTSLRKVKSRGVGRQDVYRKTE